MGSGWSLSVNCNNTSTEFVVNWKESIFNGVTPTGNVGTVTLLKDGSVVTGVQFDRTAPVGFNVEGDILCCPR